LLAVIIDQLDGQNQVLANHAPSHVPFITYVVAGIDASQISAKILYEISLSI